MPDTGESFDRTDFVLSTRETAQGCGHRPPYAVQRWVAENCRRKMVGMKRHLMRGPIILIIVVITFAAPGVRSQEISIRATHLHERAIVVDTHDDTTQRLISDKRFGIGSRNRDGNIEIPRMREGGLDAIF
jgi:hypothetical protein